MSSGPMDSARDVGLQGHYAGFVSRLGSFFIDLFVIAVAFSLAGTVLEYIVSAATGNDFSVSDYPVVANIALLAWAFFYCAYSLAARRQDPRHGPDRRAGRARATAPRSVAGRRCCGCWCSRSASSCSASASS